MTFHFEEQHIKAEDEWVQWREPAAKPLVWDSPNCQGQGELAVHVWLTCDGGEPEEGLACQCGKVKYGREGR